MTARTRTGAGETGFGHLTDKPHNFIVGLVLLGMSCLEVTARYIASRRRSWRGFFSKIPEEYIRTKKK